jgi:hypothetical protein
MSYCQFENTETDLRHVVVQMEEAESPDELSLSRTEANAFRRLAELSARYIEAYERLTALQQNDQDRATWNAVDQPLDESVEFVGISFPARLEPFLLQCAGCLCRRRLCARR